MNYWPKILHRAASRFGNCQTAIQLTFLAVVASSSCAAPAAIGPHGLNVARPYQANPQIMTLMPVTIFRNQAGYLSYESSTRRDVTASSFVRRIRTTACQSGLHLPIIVRNHSHGAVTFGVSAGFGEGTMQKALDEATESIEPGQLLSDFSLDLNTISIFSVWHQSCLILTAAVTEPHRPSVLSERP